MPRSIFQKKKESVLSNSLLVGSAAMDSGLVLRTAKWSLAAQAALTLVTASSLFFSYDKQQRTLFELSALETVAQVVEFAYYVAAVFYYGGIRTWTRYLDWVVSTPLMLTSTIAFLLYLDEPAAGLAEVFNGANLLPTLAILTLNWIMLAAGFLAEVGATPYRTALLSLGMAAFVGEFFVLYDNFVSDAGPVGFGLFLFTYLVWGGYGIAASLRDDDLKNVCYNALDLVSKNFYGLFLFVYAVWVV